MHKEKGKKKKNKKREGRVDKHSVTGNTKGMEKGTPKSTVVKKNGGGRKIN